MFQELDDQSACPRRWVKNLNVAVDQAFAEVLLAKPIGAFDHEAHNLVGRIDHPKPISCFRIVELVEVLVDLLQETLLFPNDFGSELLSNG